jgi:hypothetical protein
MDDIIAMAREAGAEFAELPMGDAWVFSEEGQLQRFAALAQSVERNKLATWMIAKGYATGHGDKMEGLLEELEREIGFDKAELWIKRINEAVLAEREACAKVCDAFESDADPDAGAVLAKAIRARGQA